MTPLLFALVATAGGIGAAARLLVDGAVRSRTSGEVPWGTAVVNVTGSFALGLLAGLAMAGVVPDAWQAVVGVGFLGGYTTFSTASLETVRLLRSGKWLMGALNGMGVLVLATASAGFGLWLGSLA